MKVVLPVPDPENTPQLERAAHARLSGRRLAQQLIVHEAAQAASRHRAGDLARDLDPRIVEACRIDREIDRLQALVEPEGHARDVADRDIGGVLEQKRARRAGPQAPRGDRRRRQIEHSARVAQRPELLALVDAVDAHGEQLQPRRHRGLDRLLGSGGSARGDGDGSGHRHASASPAWP
ncbi:MAG: hypothetical protein WDN24_01725 [Sphingomonas sp.]